MNVGESEKLREQTWTAWRPVTDPGSPAQLLSDPVRVDFSRGFNLKNT
jgi:hypothetical protein